MFPPKYIRIICLNLRLLQCLHCFLGAVPAVSVMLVGVIQICVPGVERRLVGWDNSLVLALGTH